ncbi:MAG: hypothetical protein KAS66_10500 [Candidatus Omnitrophica bacterium]|nr:hypothetical protein [Candidatus Omnitrophota bacterium]
MPSMQKRLLEYREEKEMKILRLRLRGSIGVKKGLGLDEIDLDLSGLSGLIALSGDNGSAKTTVLEMLQPYAQMISRKGKLQDHFFLRDSEKEFVFKFQGDHYRTLLKIDSESGRCEGYIWKNHNKKSEVDSKISNYKKYIIALMGSPELFFNSIFCAQNFDKLSDMRAGELKKLFGEFLRLGLLVKYEDTAKQCANIFSGKAEGLNREIETLKISANDYDQSATELSSLITESQRYEQGLISLHEDFEKADAELSGIRGKMQKNELIKAELDSLQITLNRLADEIEKDQDQSKSEIDILRAKYKNTESGITALNSLLANEAEIVQAASEKDKTEKAIANDKGLLEAAIKECFATSRSMAEKDIELSTLNLKYRTAIGEAKSGKERLLLKIKHTISQKLAKKEAEALKISSKYDKLVSNARKDWAILESRLTTSKLSAMDLNNRDEVLRTANEPSCESKACPFITTALLAQQAIPGIEAEATEQEAIVINLKKTCSDTLEPINAAIESLRGPNAGGTLAETQQSAELSTDIAFMEADYSASLATLNADMETLKSDGFITNKDKEAIEIRIAELENKLEKVKLLSSELPKVKTALVEKQGLEKLLAENTADGKRVKGLWEKRIIEKKEQLEETNAMAKKKESGIDEDAETNLLIMNKKISATKDSIETLTNKISDNTKNITLKEKEVAEKEQSRKDLKAKTGERELILKESSDWLYLKTACSANGLRALEIDSVAPVITGYANDLLLSTFGPNAMINLRTQDDEGREVLDIQILDEDGDAVTLGNRSGGQQAWALKAMRLAMALINNEKSGKDFQALLSDEETGPLDNENALKYIKLYRAFMAQGHFEQCFYVTHNINCVLMADHVLRFCEGKIVID